jgi:hypothetical protein
MSKAAEGRVRPPQCAESVHDWDLINRPNAAPVRKIALAEEMT